MSKKRLKITCFFCVLVLLIFAFVYYVNNIPVRIATGLTPTKASVLLLGGNLNGQVDYSTDFAFADAMKTAGPFYSLNPGSNGLNTNSLAPVDVHGWPTTDFGFYVNELTPPGGTYHFSCISNAQPTLSFASMSGNVQNTAYDSKSKLFTADVVVNPIQGVDFILALQNTNGGATNIKVVRPGYDALKPPVFTTEYLNLINSLSPNVLRFMDWHETNNSLEANWSERALPTDASQELKLTKTVQVDSTQLSLTKSKGIAWEYIIDLANQLNKDMWINIPLLATDDYVNNLAQLIKTKLKPQLKVYLEYSNEVWNDSFLQTGMNRAAAANEVAAGSTLNYDGSTDIVTLGDRRVAKRLKEISDIYSQVFGVAAINTRIRPVLAYQIGAVGRFANQLSFINQLYGPPNKFFYAIAIAPYFNMNGQDSNPNLSSDDVLKALSSSIDNYQNSNTIEDAVTVGTYYGLRLAAYEGGPDTYGPNNIAAKKAATLDPRMKDLVQRYLNIWYNKGGDQFNWFTLGAGSFDNQYGSWSITNDLSNLSQPKELGYNAVRTSPRPALTVGTALPAEVDARTYLGNGEKFIDPYIRYISAGSAFDYLIRLSNPGTYNLKVSIGTSNAGSPMDILINNSKVTTVNMPTDGLSDYGDTFVDTNPIPLNLQAGLNVVRLSVPTYRPYNINSLKFYKSDGSGIRNTLPMMGGFSFYWQQTISQNSSFSQSFTVNDGETSPANLSVSSGSDNTALVPPGAITLTRDSNNSRQFYFTVTPRSGQTGVANITFTVTDGGGLTRSISFKLTVQ